MEKVLKKSIKKNYLYNMSYQILSLITPFITTPYISRVLGAEGVGVISFTESIVAFFSLFATLGITIYGQREISYVQDDINKRSQIFWNIKTLQFIISGLMFVVYVIFSLYQNNTLIYLIFSLNILAVFVDITWFFQGMEEFGKIVFINFIFKIIHVVFIFIVIKSKDDLMLYGFWISLFPFLINLILWSYLPKYILSIKLFKMHPFSNFKVIVSLFLPTVAIQMYTIFDKTMIGIITQNSMENGYYEQATKISKMGLTIIAALGTVMISRISYYFEQKNSEEIKRLMYQSYRFVWFIGVPICLGIIAVADNFVPWFLGSEYGKVTILLHILPLLILPIGISNVTGIQYLVPTKRQNILTITVVVGACINFILNLILINLYQSLGAAIASVISEIVISWSQLLFVRNEISLLKILKDGVNYLFAGILMFVFVRLLGVRLPATILHTLFMAICGGLIYFSVLLTIHDEFFLSNILVILNKIRKRCNSQ